jgi:serine/threonine protein kinase
MNHPSLVQFYGLYQDKAREYPYFVMEFCEGGTLQGALEEEEHVPSWSKRWQWALQITEALAYLHSEGSTP